MSEAIGGARKHESLTQAASYALLMESQEVASFLHDKLMERNALIYELSRQHVESGGTLLPGVPAEGGLLAFMAIEELARTNPGLHPVLKQVADLEKMKYLAGLGAPGSLVN